MVEQARPAEVRESTALTRNGLSTQCAPSYLDCNNDALGGVAVAPALRIEEAGGFSCASWRLLRTSGHEEPVKCSIVL